MTVVEERAPASANPQPPMPMTRFLLLAPLAIALAACQTPMGTASGPDVAAASQVRADIAQASADHIAAINRQDGEAFVSYFTETAVESPSDGSQAVGREAIRANVTNFLRAGEAAIELVPQEILPLGDGFAYERANVTMRLDGAVVQQGVITRLWTQTPDGWKITRDTWTSAPTAD